MLPRSYPLSDKVTMTTTGHRFFDVRYSQVYLNIHGAEANEVMLDVPAGPPLPRVFQIFQIRLTSESYLCEWSLHKKPYNECKNVDFVFKCETDSPDEMLQETWLVSKSSFSVTPYLFFSFKELAGLNPGPARLEFRVTG